MNAALEFDLRPVTTPTGDAEREALMVDPGFGRIFTDHMVMIDYTEEAGWHNARLVPYGPMAIEPACAVLHYAQSVFEGLKVYRHPDDSVALFRPEANAHRFAASADRLALPRLPEDVFMESVRILVKQDAAWIPTAPETSLYLRPLMFASERFLGVRPANGVTYVLFASPVGAYFSDGVKPVSVWLTTDYSRAAPGGTGAAKAAANYAQSLAGQVEAAERGCDQVVWLDAAEHRYIEEMGGMNLFLVFGEGENARLVTAPLTGTILPGITRDSLLDLGPDMGYRTEERRVTVDEWAEGVAKGEVTEAFACGTAAVITPIGTVRSVAGEFTIADGAPGPITIRLREKLLGIQYGKEPDPYGWVHPVA